MQEEMITVVVGREELAGREEYSASVFVVWSTAEKPQFELVGPDRLYTTLENVYSIVPLNYDPEVEQIGYKWVLSRDDGAQQLELESSTPGFLVLDAFILDEYTQYTVQAIVWNQEKPAATATQSVTLTTQAPPKSGIVRAKPN